MGAGFCGYILYSHQVHNKRCTTTLINVFLDYCPSMSALCFPTYVLSMIFKHILNVVINIGIALINIFIQQKHSETFGQHKLIPLESAFWFGVIFSVVSKLIRHSVYDNHTIDV